MFHRYRVLSVPFAVLGLVACFYLARGKQPPKTPQTLVTHLEEAGFQAELGEAWAMEEIGEHSWRLTVDGGSYLLRRAQSVVAAASEYKARRGGSPVPPPSPYGSSRLWRNNAYLLEPQGEAAPEADAVGEAFERW